MADLIKHPISKLDAKERSEGTAQACALWVKAGFTLVRQIQQCLDDGVPEKMDMKPSQWKAVYCKHVSRSHLNRQLQISSAMAGLPTRELESLPEGNAYLLATKVKESERTKQVWLDRARDMSLEAFEDVVAHATGAHGQTPEEWATFSLKAPVSVCELAHELIKRLALAYGMDIELKPESAFIPFGKLSSRCLQMSIEGLFDFVEGNDAQ